MDGDEPHLDDEQPARMIVYLPPRDLFSRFAGAAIRIYRVMRRSPSAQRGAAAQARADLVCAACHLRGGRRIFT